MYLGILYLDTELVRNSRSFKISTLSILGKIVIVSPPPVKYPKYDL